MGRGSGAAAARAAREMAMNRLARTAIAVAAGLMLCASGASVASAEADYTYTTTTTTVTTAPATSMYDVAPEHDAYASERPLAPEPWDKAAEFVLSMSSVMFNVVIFPVKLAVGVAGAEVGGIAGALNGGDEEAAAGIWNVTTDGSYFATPEILDGRDRFHYAGDSR